MKIQIFGKSKCFDTKKAERYFKERGIKYQFIDIIQTGLSKGELNSVIKSIGLDNIVSDKAEEYHLYKHLVYEDRFDKLLEHPRLYKTPIVRNGKNATVGYAPEIWKSWE